MFQDQSDRRLDRRRYLGGAVAVAAAAAVGTTVATRAAANQVANHPITYRTTTVEGRTVFYREAGDPAAPTILLLHGFPSSSHMFRGLIPLLADRYHLVAPDYPGFGHSDAPSPAEFAYTFDQLAAIVEGVIDGLGLDRYSLYVQDYGAPVGYRIAARRPERVEALIVQNGNAYAEGITEFAQPLRTFGEGPRNAETERPLRAFLTREATIFQYTEGVQDRARISPDAWTMDQYFLNRPGNDDIQLTLFHDYLSNINLYPAWHRYFREHQPPTLVVWGKNDPIFGAPGAEAFRRDLPEAEIHLLDTGHFALEDHAEVIADHIDRFLSARLGKVS